MRVFGRNLLSLAMLVFIAIPTMALVSQAPPLGFAQPRPYNWTGGYWVSSVAVADLNRDGNLDLVAVYQGKVGVLLGNGDGTFKRVIKYSPGGSNPSSVAIADVNGDGKPDVLVLNYDSYKGVLGVLLGDGNGSFEPPVSYNTGPIFRPQGFAVGDLNGDGHPDVAVADDFFSWEEPGDVSVLYNDGHGKFGSPFSCLTGGSGMNLAVTIVNGAFIASNSCVDPDWSSWCGSTAVWPLGTVCRGPYGPCYDSGGDIPIALATGDLNGDGYFDIVVANAMSPFSDPNLGVLLGTGSGFRDVVTYSAATWSIAVGDVNGDGKPDIVVDGTGVLLGNGGGTFQTIMNFGGVGTKLVLGDLTGDGKLDVIGNEGIMLNTSGFITGTHITSSLNPSFVNQSVTFTATVTSNHGLIPDGEFVKFYTGTKLLASVPLSGGRATYTTSTLTAETHIMKAKYAGDTMFAPSAGQIKQLVQ